VEHSLHPRLGKDVFEESNSPLTMSGDVGTEAAIRRQLKNTTREVKGTRQLTGQVLTTTMLTSERTRVHHE